MTLDFIIIEDSEINCFILTYSIMMPLFYKGDLKSSYICFIQNYLARKYIMIIFSLTIYTSETYNSILLIKLCKKAGGEGTYRFMTATYYRHQCELKCIKKIFIAVIKIGISLQYITAKSFIV